MAARSRIFAVVLAAGESRRFGGSKQIARLPGSDETLVRRSTRLADAACRGRVLLVAGHDAGVVAADAADWGCFVVHNERYPEGLGTSVACAARSLAHAADALLLILADQPMISEAHLLAVCNSWTGNPLHTVATAFGDEIGPPALLPRGTFSRLQMLSGDRGAKSLFHDDDVLLSTLRFDRAGVDIDTPDDLANLDHGAA